MNKRIRELDKQAVDYAMSVCDANGLYQGKEYLTVVKEKFAELIVNECMNQVREQYLPVLEDEHMMKDTHWAHYVQCGVDSYVAIKEHFGVEE